MSPSRDQWILAGILLLAAVAMVIMSRDARTAVAPSATPLASVQSSGAQTKLRLLFTGDSRGYIKPCGCSAKLFGGVARRATWLSRHRKRTDVLIELGNLASGTRPHDRLKLRYMFEALEALDYDILVPGTGELLVGLPFEQLASSAKKLSVVCANLVHKGTGKPVFEPMAVVATDDGEKVAVIGLTSPSQELSDRYSVLPFDDVLPGVIARASQIADRVVIAGFIKGQPALELAQKYPEVALVAASWVPAGSPSLIRRGGVPVMLGGDRGQYVFWASIGSDHVFDRGGQEWMGDDLPDNPALSELVARHDVEAQTLGPSHKERVQSLFRERGRLKSESCAECHQSEYDSWRKSKHAHAMDTLALKRSANDPNCLGCHYQDVASEPDQVVGVGCSTCHDQSKSHVQSMRANPVTSGRRAAVQVHAQRCVRCHDSHNSPQFDLANYWREIQHGGEGK